MTRLSAILLLVLAVAAQNSLPRVAVWFAGLDFVLAAVIAISLRSGPSAGVVAGTVAGLMQDAFGTGLLGIGALGKTVAGSAAGAIAGQFVLGSPVARLSLYLGASLINALILFTFYQLTATGGSPMSVTRALAEALGTAAVGVTGEQVAEWVRLTRSRRASRRQIRP